MTHNFPYKWMVHAYIHEGQNIFVMTVPGHVDKDPDSNDHYSGILAFFCDKANNLYEAIKEVTQPTEPPNK